MTDQPLVSIVIPAKDEAENLPRLLSELSAVVRQIQNYRFEVIVVSDHSTDNTAQVAQAGGALVVENLRAPGKGNALITGFEKAQGSLFIMMDADYSHRPEDIPSFLRELEKGHGLVVGSRSMGGSDEYTFIRTLGNVGLSALFRFFMGVRTTDVLNGYKAFRREVFTHYKYDSAQFEIEIELMANTVREGWTVGEFACHERSRSGGEAKSRVIKHGFRFLFKILEMAFVYHTERLIKPSKSAQFKTPLK
jgi:glycosyltransferase involved in cell wall biosynthesis